MKMPFVVAVASVACLVSISCHGSELTRAQAKKAFEKIAEEDQPTDKITLSAEQMQRLKSIPNANTVLSKVFNLVSAPPQEPWTFANPTNKAASFVDGGQWCLPDPSDARLMSGQFVQCQDYAGLDISWQRPGIRMLLRKPIRWVVLEVTGVTEGSTSSEKIVDVTWQFDLSSFPREIQDAIKQPLLQGKALFKLYDDGWRFEKLVFFNQL